MPFVCTDATGTIWNGECRQLLRVDSFGSRSELGDLRWHISVWSLLSLHPQADLLWQLGDARARATLQWSPKSNWQIRDLSLVSTYRSLNPLADPGLRRLWRDMPGTAGLSLELPVAFGNAQEIQQLQGVVRFFAYGEHVLTISADGRGALRSNEGALRLSGPLEWQRDGRYRLQIKASLSGDADPALREALRALGPVDPRGEYDLTIEGSIWTLLR